MKIKPRAIREPGQDAGLFGSRRSTHITAFVAWSALSVFVFWFLGAMNGGLCHDTSRGDLVDAYAEALSQGSPYLLTPTARLAQLPIEQQPNNDPRGRILDASYFEGRYYLYFGILPFAAVLAPWKAVTGAFLDAEVYIGAAISLGNLFVVVGFLRLDHGSGKLRDALACLLGACVAIVCSGCLVLMDIPGIHQVECATAYALNCAVFLALVYFEKSQGTGFKPLLFAVAAACCLMGARPNQAIPVACILFFALLQVHRSSLAAPAKGRLICKILFIPLVIGTALASYNYARFGNILEFGVNHSTFAVSQRELLNFHVGNVPYNLRAYLFGFFQTERYFPFISGPFEPASHVRPESHEGLDQVYGIFWIYPALLLGAAALYSRHKLALGLVVLGASSLVTLSGFGFGTYRYTADFSVYFALAAGIGCFHMCVEHRGFRGVLALSAACGFAIVSTAGAVCLASSVAAIHGGMNIHRRADFETLATPFNWFRYRYEQSVGQPPRAIGIEVEFPPRFGAVEPLVVTGWPGLQDFIYVHYLDASSIRIGFESMGRGGPVSAPIPIEYGKQHRLELVLGSSFPPATHPIFEGLAPAQIDSFYDTLQVFLDGALVMHAKVKLHPEKGYLYLGKSPFDAAFGSVFTGKLIPTEGPLLQQYLKRM